MCTNIINVHIYYMCIYIMCAYILYVQIYIYRERESMVYTVDYYSAIKKNKKMSFSEIWMELEIIMLSKVSQAQKAKHHMFI
jgi:hypothetical protein